MILIPGGTNVEQHLGTELRAYYTTHGKSLSHVANVYVSLGFLATITPTLSAAFTADAAFVITVGAATVVKQRATFPSTEVLLNERDSQRLPMRSLHC